MNRRTVSLACVATLALMCTSMATAADSARAGLEKFTHDIHSLSCSFVQQVTDARGELQSDVQGTLALESPRQFRWHTHSPQEQLIVADGARVWIYDPELEQVTVRHQSAAEAHSPLTVLTDLSRLDKDFTVTEPGQRDGLNWLRLTPKGEDTQFEFAEIGMAEDTPQQMVFTDTLGGQSRITFSDWQRNPKLPAGTFQFTPPEGADVVGDKVEVPQIRGTGD